MNLHHNLNDDECDNSISSQGQQIQQHGHKICSGQYANNSTQQSTTHYGSSYSQTSRILQKKIITMSNSTTASQTTATTIKLFINTCPLVVEEQQQQEQQQLERPGQLQEQHHNVQPLQKWRQRPRGQTLSKTKPVIRNLLNINTMFKLQNVCKYFLVMFVVILTSFPAATVMALPSLMAINTNNTTSLANVIQQNREYKNDRIATISQSVNSSSNYSNSNSSNRNNNDATTNSAVKLILNDYNDAFLQMLPMAEHHQAGQHENIKNHLLEMEPEEAVLLHNDLLDSLRGTHCLPRQPMYTNEFAVHIPAGKYIADVIADKYGFINMGQVSD